MYLDDLVVSACVALVSSAVHARVKMSGSGGKKGKETRSWWDSFWFDDTSKGGGDKDSDEDEIDIVYADNSVASGNDESVRDAGEALIDLDKTMPSSVSSSLVYTLGDNSMGSERNDLVAKQQQAWEAATTTTAVPAPAAASRTGLGRVRELQLQSDDFDVLSFDPDPEATVHVPVHIVDNNDDVSDEKTHVSIPTSAPSQPLVDLSAENVEESSSLTPESLDDMIARQAAQRRDEYFENDSDLLVRGGANVTESASFGTLFDASYTTDQQLVDPRGRQDILNGIRVLSDAFQRPENALEYDSSALTQQAVGALQLYKRMLDAMATKTADSKMSIGALATAAVSLGVTCMTKLNDSIREDSSYFGAFAKGALLNQVTLELQLDKDGANRASKKVLAALAGKGSIALIKSLFPGLSALDAEKVRKSLAETQKGRDEVERDKELARETGGLLDTLSASVPAAASAVVELMRYPNPPSLDESIDSLNLSIEHPEVEWANLPENGRTPVPSTFQYAQTPMPGTSANVRELERMFDVLDGVKRWTDGAVAESSVIGPGASTAAAALPSMQPTQLTDYTQTGLTAALRAVAEAASKPADADTTPAEPETSDADAAPSGFMGRAYNLGARVIGGAANLGVAVVDFVSNPSFGAAITGQSDKAAATRAQFEAAVESASLVDAHEMLRTILSGIKRGEINEAEIDSNSMQMLRRVTRNGMTAFEVDKPLVAKLQQSATVADAVRYVVPQSWGSIWSGVKLTEAGVALAGSVAQSYFSSLRGVARAGILSGAIDKSSGLMYSAAEGAIQDPRRLLMRMAAAFFLHAGFKVVQEATAGSWTSLVHAVTGLREIHKVTTHQVEYVCRYTVEPCMYFNIARMMLLWVNTTVREALNAKPIRASTAAQLIMMRGVWVSVADAAVALHLAAISREVACDPARFKVGKYSTTADSHMAASLDVQEQMCESYEEVRKKCLTMVADAFQQTQRVWSEIATYARLHDGGEQFCDGARREHSGAERAARRMDAATDASVAEELRREQERAREELMNLQQQQSELWARASEVTDAEDDSKTAAPSSSLSSLEPANPYATSYDPYAPESTDAKRTAFLKKYESDVARGGVALRMMFMSEMNCALAGTYNSVESNEIIAGARIISGLKAFSLHVRWIFDLPQYGDRSARPTSRPSNTGLMDDQLVTAALVFDCFTVVSAMHSRFVTPNMMTSIAVRTYPDAGIDATLGDRQAFQLGDLTSLGSKPHPLREGALYVAGHKLAVYAHERQFGCVGTRVSAAFESDYDRRRMFRLARICALAGKPALAGSATRQEVQSQWRVYAGVLRTLIERATNPLRPIFGIMMMDFSHLGASPWTTTLGQHFAEHLSEASTSDDGKRKTETADEKHMREVVRRNTRVSMLLKPISFNVSAQSGRDEFETIMPSRGANATVDVLRALYPWVQRRWSWRNLEQFALACSKSTSLNTMTDAARQFHNTDSLYELCSIRYNGWYVRRERRLRAKLPVAEVSAAAEATDASGSSTTAAAVTIPPHFTDTLLRHNDFVVKKSAISVDALKYDDEQTLDDPWMNMGEQAVQDIFHSTHAPDLVSRMFVDMSQPGAYLFEESFPVRVEMEEGQDSRTLETLNQRRNQHERDLRAHVEDTVSGMHALLQDVYARRSGVMLPKLKKKSRRRKALDALGSLVRIAKSQDYELVQVELSYRLLCARFIAGVFRLLVWALFIDAYTPPRLQAAFLLYMRRLGEHCAHVLTDTTHSRRHRAGDEDDVDDKVSDLFPLAKWCTPMWAEMFELSTMHGYRSHPLLLAIWNAACDPEPVPRHPAGAADGLDNKHADDPFTGVSLDDISREYSTPREAPARSRIGFRPFVFGSDWKEGTADVDGRPCLSSVVIDMLNESLGLRPMALRPFHDGSNHAFVRTLEANAYLQHAHGDRQVLALRSCNVGPQSLEEQLGYADMSVYATELREIAFGGLEGVDTGSGLMAPSLHAQAFLDKTRVIYKFTGADVLSQYLLRRLYLEPASESTLPTLPSPRSATEAGAIPLAIAAYQDIRSRFALRSEKRVETVLEALGVSRFEQKSVAARYSLDLTMSELTEDQKRWRDTLNENASTDGSFLHTVTQWFQSHQHKSAQYRKFVDGLKKADFRNFCVDLENKTHHVVTANEVCKYLDSKKLESGQELDATVLLAGLKADLSLGNVTTTTSTNVPPPTGAGDDGEQTSADAAIGTAEAVGTSPTAATLAVADQKSHTPSVESWNTGGIDLTTYEAGIKSSQDDTTRNFDSGGWVPRAKQAAAGLPGVIRAAPEINPAWTGVNVLRYILVRVGKGGGSLSSLDDSEKALKALRAHVTTAQEYTAFPGDTPDIVNGSSGSPVSSPDNSNHSSPRTPPQSENASGSLGQSFNGGATGVQVGSGANFDEDNDAAQGGSNSDSSSESESESDADDEDAANAAAAEARKKAERAAKARADAEAAQRAEAARQEEEKKAREEAERKLYIARAPLGDALKAAWERKEAVPSEKGVYPSYRSELRKIVSSGTFMGDVSPKEQVVLEGVIYQDPGVFAAWMRSLWMKSQVFMTPERVKEVLKAKKDLGVSHWDQPPMVVTQHVVQTADLDVRKGWAARFAAHVMSYVNVKRGAGEKAFWADHPKLSLAPYNGGQASGSASSVTAGTAAAAATDIRRSNRLNSSASQQPQQQQPQQQQPNQGTGVPAKTQLIRVQKTGNGTFMAAMSNGDDFCSGMWTPTIVAAVSDSVEVVLARASTNPYRSPQAYALAIAQVLVSLRTNIFKMSPALLARRWNYTDQDQQFLNAQKVHVFFGESEPQWWDRDNIPDHSWTFHSPFVLHRADDRKSPDLFKDILMDLYVPFVTVGADGYKAFVEKMKTLAPSLAQKYNKGGARIIALHVANDARAIPAMLKEQQENPMPEIKGAVVRSALVTFHGAVTHIAQTGCLCSAVDMLVAYCMSEFATDGNSGFELDSIHDKFWTHEQLEKFAKTLMRNVRNRLGHTLPDPNAYDWGTCTTFGP